jgi:site-specific DNA-methyltransferase (adenine-specific)
MNYKEFENTKIYNENVLDLYDDWESPTVIISDGAYGVNGFPTDPNNVSKLTNWYEEHIKNGAKMLLPKQHYGFGTQKSDGLLFIPY